MLAQRARVARLVVLAKRVGYLLFAAAIVFFMVGLFSEFPGWAAMGATITLVGGCVVLAPAILLGYAVKGAERHDREQDPRRPSDL